MKRLILILALLPLLGAGQSVITGYHRRVMASSIEYLRPTADADSTSLGLRSAACGPTAINHTSVSNSAAYTGKSSYTPPYGSNVNQAVSGSASHNNYTMRVFSSWQTTANTYSSLTVNLNAMCSISDLGDNVGGACGAAYSTDGGSTWTSLYSYTSTSTNGDSQSTRTATITGATLSNLQVGVCVLARQFSVYNSGATIYFNDLWTDGWF